MKISQSFIKDMLDYQNGELCGNMLSARWVDGRLFPGSEAMKLGCFFEFELTKALTGKGTLPKDEIEPKAVMMASGKDMVAEYRLAMANVKRITEYFSKMGIKVLSAGERVTEGKFVGTIDLRCVAEKDIWIAKDVKWKAGHKFVLDLKYSGLIADKWSKFGWAGLLLPGDHPQKDHHKIQATHYSMITGLPFYYLVTSSKNNVDVVLIGVPVDDGMIENHKMLAKGLVEDFEFWKGIGFEARPEVSKCKECPLFDECKDKHEFPHLNIMK